MTSAESRRVQAKIDQDLIALTDFIYDARRPPEPGGAGGTAPSVDGKDIEPRLASPSPALPFTKFERDRCLGRARLGLRIAWTFQFEEQIKPQMQVVPAR